MVTASGFTVGGSDGWTLLASGHGDDTGGGLFAFDGADLKCIDRLSCAGLFYTGKHLFRLLTTWDKSALAEELLIYDTQGVVRYYRIDGVTDTHDILWDGEHVVFVATSDNAILWLDTSGKIVRRWQATVAEDAWHLNCLLLKDDELYVSAFGRFNKSREWKDTMDIPTGVIFNVATGEDLVTGLMHPHHPRWIDGTLVVCNSGPNAKELLQIDVATGEKLRSLHLQGFPRGLISSDDYLFVGESASRFATTVQQRAMISIVDRRNWEICRRVEIPSRELYDLVLVPSGILNGVQRGFHTSPARAIEQSQLALFEQVGISHPPRFWATGDPLPREAFAAHITAELPLRMVAGMTSNIHCNVENKSDYFWVSAPPNPVYLTYKWTVQETGVAVSSENEARTKFAHSLPPHETEAVVCRVTAPSTIGAYTLHITLVQEHVAWFDEVNPANSVEATVQVVVDKTP
jgi:uncharacterized protein (TIGR03032 family)